MAVANNKGIVTIRLIDWAKVDARVQGSLDDVKYTLELIKDKKRPLASWMEVMVYSPCNNYLAVGSHDDTVYIIDTKTYKKINKTKNASSSFITGLDWSTDSTYIRTVDGSYELLFF